MSQPDRERQSANKEIAEIGRSALAVSGATLISRILGLARDSAILALFSVTATDAFFLAFLIPNAMRRLVAEGSLTVAFVPLFSEALADSDPERGRREAQRFVSVAFTGMAAFLLVLSALGALAAPWIVRTLVPGAGFSGVAGKMEMTIELTRWLFPYIFFISLVALSMGILNARRRFFAPAFAPALLNVSMIAAALLLRDLFDRPIHALVVGVLAGGAIQLLFQVPFLLKVGFFPKPDFRLGLPRFRRLIALMIPAAFGVAVYQTYIFVARFFASFLPEGTVSYHFAADRLIQFPLALIAIALGTAMLPALSDHAAHKRIDGLNRAYAGAFSMMMFLMIPATVGLMILRIPILNVLFQRGPTVDAAYIAEVGRALWFFSIGLCAVGAIRITTPIFFSLQDTRTPVLVATVTLAANIVISYLFVLKLNLDQGWLAFAGSISSLMHVAILWILLTRKLSGFRPIGSWVELGKIAIASTAMGIVGIALAGRLDWTGPSPLGWGLAAKSVGLAGIILTCIAVYAVSTRLLGSQQWEPLAAALRRRANRRKS